MINNSQKKPSYKKGFTSNHLLMIAVFTPVVCALVWFISWMYAH